jgi:Family of unknown function (DUF6134)
MDKKLALILGLLAFTIEPATADTPAPASKIKRIYDITRDGSKIGSDIVEIEKQGDVATVKFTTHVSVKIAFVEVYHMDRTSSETWNANQLVSFTSQTNDYGTKHVVAATAAGEKIHFDVDGKASDAPRKVVPNGIWSKAFLSSGQIFDDGTGKLLSIKVSDLGVAQQTRHYHIAGDFERDLWFEGDTLVRLRMVGPDGSKVSSDLRP